MRTPLLATVALLAFTAVGCAMSPATLESDVSMGVSTGLSGVVLLEPAKTAEIKADAAKVASVINKVIVPQFQGANSATLLNSAVTTSLTMLSSTMNGSKHGAVICGLITLAQGPFNSLLGNTASPTALLSASAQAYAAAFFRGVSEGIAAFTGDPTLNPPAPPPPSTAPPPPPPAPTPPPGK